MTTAPDVKSQKWDVGKRWTPALVEDGFTPVPTTFLENYTRLGITPAEAIFILQLMTFKWGKGRPFPRLSLIATRMKMSETAVRGHARSLEGKKLLMRISRPGRSNEFDLTPLFKKLELVQEEVRQERREKARPQAPEEDEDE